MAHSFRDRNRENQVVRDGIKANTELIGKYSTALQRDVADLQELLTIASWYINDQMMTIDKHYEDAPLDHLKSINRLYSDYCGELMNMDTVVRQLIYVLNKYFDYNNPDILTTAERVIGDK